MTPKNQTVFVLSRLRSGQTEHSALENYTKGFYQGFVTAGLRVYLLNLAAIDRCERPHGRVLRLLARVEPVSLMISFFYSVFLAITYWRQRANIVVFVNNSARNDIPFLFLFKTLGYRIVFWITDYYPARKAFTDTLIQRYATEVIAINGYIAAAIPDHIPCNIFYGGTTQKAPDLLNRPFPGAPLHLFYAGKLNALNAIDIILDVVAHAPDSMRLTLFGDGPMADLAQDYATRYAQIDMQGLVPRAQVLDAMQSAHVVLSVRRLDDDYYKGFFPSKLIEMLCTPAQLVISDMGNITDMLEPVAILVDYANETQIKQAICLARDLSPSQEAQMLVQRKTLVAEVFDWTRLGALVANSGSRQ